MKFWPLFLRNFTYFLIIIGCASFVLFPFAGEDSIKHHAIKKKQVVKNRVNAVAVEPKMITTLPNTTKIAVNPKVEKKAALNVVSTKVNTNKQEVKPIKTQPSVKIPPVKQPLPVVKQHTANKVPVKKYGYHKVAQGENLWRIAQKYGTSASAIAYANHIRNYNNIITGQTLIIPVYKK